MSGYEEALNALVDAVCPADADDARRLGVADGYRAVGRAYVRRGLRYAAVGLFAADPPDGLAHASLTLTAVPSAHTSVTAAVAGLVEALARDPDLDVEPAALHCGPAVTVVRREYVSAVDPASPESRRFSLVTGHVQFHVPSPTAPWVYNLDMATPSLVHWARFAVLAAQIADSLAFVHHAEAGGTPSM